ncbi:hypothetical protein B0H11DRAFT_1909318 [Mycena galericulata]|nr:hypothetical protein B0H11DRAFT_1909318 [Mycena galericulata]
MSVWVLLHTSLEVCPCCCLSHTFQGDIAHRTKNNLCMDPARNVGKGLGVVDNGSSTSESAWKGKGKAVEGRVILCTQLEKTKPKHAKLIPRPEDQAGRSGGYNLQNAMGLKGDDEAYLRSNPMVKIYIQEHLSVFHTISQQETGKVSRMR